MAGIITDSAKFNIARFTGYFVSKAAPGIASLFNRDPNQGCLLLGLKEGLTESFWNLVLREYACDCFSVFEHEEAVAIQSNNFAALDVALDKLIMQVWAKDQISSDFSTRTLYVGLCCMQICNGKQLSIDEREKLVQKFKSLENTHFPTSTVTLEGVLLQLLKEQRHPEFLFMFFVILYTLDYEDFRQYAKKAFQNPNELF